MPGMVGDNTIERSPLLPDRRTQGDFFVCDLFDAAPKGDMASMEHPVFSLSTRPDHRVRRYEHKGAYIEIKPSADGLATIHDRDILIYCTSQLMAALNDGKSVSQYVRFRAFDLLSATNRGHDGRGYEQLKAAFERLAGTRITTNITTGNVEILDGFGLIDSFRIIRATRDGRMQEVEIRLSDWVFNAIRHREVLTIHRDYFRLRKPLERRMYELARKHCGRKDEWRILAPYAAEEVRLRLDGQGVQAPGAEHCRRGPDAQSYAGLRRAPRRRGHAGVPQPEEHSRAACGSISDRTAPRSRDLSRCPYHGARLGRAFSRTAVARVDHRATPRCGCGVPWLLQEMVREAGRAVGTSDSRNVAAIIQRETRSLRMSYSCCPGRCALMNALSSLP